MQRREHVHINLWGLAFAVLAGEVTLVVYLVAAYVATPTLCDRGAVWLLHLITALAAAVALLAVFVAVKDWRKLSSIDGTERTLREQRFAFLASQGVYLAALSAFGIILSDIAFIFSRCG